MERLKHNLSDFRKIFERDITVRDIATFDLCTCTYNDNAISIKAKMKRDNFDVLPMVGENGFIESYVKRKALGEGLCCDYAESILPTQLISDSAPLINLLNIMRSKKYLFVMRVNKVEGIVTRADLQKLPVRIFIFGLITLLEMHFSNMIRIHFKRNVWLKYLSRYRKEKVCKLYKNSKKYNNEIDLVECLCLYDKITIISSTHELMRKLNIESNKKHFKMFLKSVGQLRNKLAHAHVDIAKGHSWDKIIELVSKIEFLVKKCEEGERVIIES